MPQAHFHLEVLCGCHEQSEAVWMGEKRTFTRERQVGPVGAGDGRFHRTGGERTPDGGALHYSRLR